MIRTEEKIIPAQPEKKTTVEIYICDICGKEQWNMIYVCELCKRHFCYGWKQECGKRDPHETGDYPSRYCKICWDLMFVKYEAERNTIEEEEDRKTEELSQKILAESLATKK